MRTELKEERERLVAKLIVAEEGKRVSEAALKENDTMWEQLFNTKITELQSQCADALQLHSSRIQSADDDSGAAESLEKEEYVHTRALLTAKDDLEETVMTAEDDLEEIDNA